jgi:hypothetical protein
MRGQKLIFVYNANGGLFSSISDFAHKILSPSTYQCNLCALTYGNFLVKDEWTTFVQNLPLKTVFLYKDEFFKHYKIQVSLPAVFVRLNDTIKEIMSRDEIENCKSLEALKTLVVSKLKEHVQHHHSHIQ